MQELKDLEQEIGEIVEETEDIKSKSLGSMRELGHDLRWEVLTKLRAKSWMLAVLHWMRECDIRCGKTLHDCVGAKRTCQKPRRSGSGTHPR